MDNSKRRKLHDGSSSSGHGGHGGTSAASSTALFNTPSVDEYSKITRIGEGTYGDVYAARCKRTGRLVALKRIILHNERQDGFPITSLREIATLRRAASCAHVVQLLDVVVGQQHKGVFLVFEYCEHDLSSLLRAHRAAGRPGSPFSESEVKTLALQLLRGLAFLHDSSYIIHRDIKLSNLLYDNRGQLKIADFGLARLFPARSNQPLMTPTVVTLWYRAVELLLGAADYGCAIDVWAAGCVMGELLLGEPLMDGDGERDQLDKIFRLLGAPSARIWPEVLRMPAVAAGTVNLRREQERYPYNNLNVVFPKMHDDGRDLVCMMLALDPKKRIAAAGCLRHDYFFSTPFPKEQDLMPTFKSGHAL